MKGQVCAHGFCLLTHHSVRSQIAARTLGDLVRKLGEKILPEIIPILEEGLRSDKSDERQGVCIGLSEIMKSTSKDAVCSSCMTLKKWFGIFTEFTT